MLTLARSRKAGLLAATAALAAPRLAAAQDAPGVTATETHIAFRTYSSHDLEAAFSLGLD